ncbi:DUF1829 domain-containing protein [Clostridium sp. KNHs216]|uniref:SF0329 family protein n=1 Tax=Clostridium sp. KNHs216 TaxID=1550235 RepID=UPI00114D817A|nr:DUF1829 domain-containing protein [Clostridium sp. KNHs216]TQI65404.1 uncharacterized protein DUF1829 [Clostridium sp. KNHs216]
MWSQTKKKLENFTCDSLKDRVKFFSSNYRMHDGIGRTYIAVDGVEVYNMCTLKRDYYRHPKPGCYSQVEFMEAVDVYLNESIENLLKSTKEKTESILFSWNDIQETRSHESQLYVFVNDEEKNIKSDMTNAFIQYGINPVLWSNRENVLEKLIA